MREFTNVNSGRSHAQMFVVSARTTASKYVQVSTEWISAIRNLVCPECGGRMGGRTKEFQCQGQCGTDWRPVWESALAP